MPTGRNSHLGPASWPVAIPEDVDSPALEKARGLITLPQHIRWSEPYLTYDLNDPSDCARVYEQVIREGTDDDVRYYIIVDRMVELWDVMVLPPHVRSAWARWLAKHRHIELAC